jgi:hypothetical protein
VSFLQQKSTGDGTTTAAACVSRLSANNKHMLIAAR